MEANSKWLHESRKHSIPRTQRTQRTHGGETRLLNMNFPGDFSIDWQRDDLWAEINVRPADRSHWEMKCSDTKATKSSVKAVVHSARGNEDVHGVLWQRGCRLLPLTH